MKDSSTSVATVPFHGDDLFLVEHEGQPFTPMKSIVEGMGLSWHGQHAKLKANTDRWGILDLRIPTKSGFQSSICIPIRKLAGWLMTITPKKIKNLEVREKVIMYQDECDDALWDYWTKGVAVNPRISLSPSHQRELQKAIAARIYAQVPKDHRPTAFKKIYSHLKDRFGVAKYDQIEESRYTEALGAVHSFELDGEWLPQQDQAAATMSDDDLSDLYILLCHAHIIEKKWRESHIEEALSILHAPIGGNLHENIQMAASFARRIAKAKGQLMERSRERLGLNYGLIPTH